MRKSFWSYYSLDEPIASHIWQSGSIVLDTNVLLNLYRYRPETRRQLLELLVSVRDRLWIPHQVAAEYQERRIDVIFDMRKPYNDLRRLVDSTRDQLQIAVREIPLRLHPTLEVADLERIVGTSFRSIADYLSAKEAELPELSGLDLLIGDDIREQLDELFDGRVGQPFSADRLRGVYEEGARRFEARVPPGYRDREKPEPQRYGDLLIWLQMIEHSKEADQPVLFITDDSKEDWWWISHGQRLGARRELSEEFLSESGCHFLILAPDRFMSLARERLGSHVTDEAVKEVVEASQSVSESAACPHCGWSPVGFQLGRQPGSSAIALCSNCRSRFHAHRRGGGEVLTTKGTLGRRIETGCPECGSAIRVDFAEGDGPKSRVCLDCFALLEIRSDETAGLVGYATVLDAEVVDDRHLACPRCDVSHPTFVRRGRSVYSVCDRSEPTLLLRAEIA